MKIPAISTALLLLLAAGCGPKPAATTTAAPTPAAKAPAAAAPAAAAAGRTVTIIASNAQNELKFDQTNIAVKVGEEITIVLRNAGTQSKAAMGHNLVILKPGANVMGVVAAAMGAAGNEFIPASTDIVAHTKLLGPNETDTIKFKPTAAGTYEFICSFTGHGVAMKGVFTVQ